jgi:Ca-activated chloride channel family protein
MKLRSFELALSTLVFFLMASVCGDEAHATQSPAGLVEAAQRAMKAGQFDDAIRLYEQSRELLPRNAEIPYNMAVAHYRKGEFEKAAEFLNQAISLTNDSKLRARSTFNLGNAAYAQSLKAAQGQADPTQAAEQVKNAKAHLKEALDHFKKAMDADPNDQDARANAELSHRMLTRLEELEQQQQQQQDGQENQQDKQNQQQDQQQQKQQQGQKNSEEQQQQRQDAGSSEPQQQDQSQSQEQDKPEQQQQPESQANQEPSSEQQADEKQDQPTAQPQPEPKQQGDEKQAAPPQKKSMTKDEAERLLQSIRDKERKRRADLAKREAAKHTRAVRDW